jgi:hypothetical protein
MMRCYPPAAGQVFTAGVAHGPPPLRCFDLQAIWQRSQAKMPHANCFDDSGYFFRLKIIGLQLA